MKLGEFRKLTENLNDDTDIVIRYCISSDEAVDVPMMNVQLKNKENVCCGSKYSDPVVFIDEPDHY